MTQQAEIKSIDQAGVRALISERLANPELYAGMPLLIRQAEWSDGIQQEVVMDTCLDFNKGKAREEWSYFRLITVRGTDTPLKEPCEKGKVAGYIITTRADISQEHYLREVDKLIEQNKEALPVIVYLPYRYEPGKVDETCFVTEHRLFTPDFEQWAAEWQNPLIPDFIRGDGDAPEGIAYRWYNRYNDPTRGCSTPDVWLATNSFLTGFIKLTRNYWKNYGIRDLGDDLIRSAFHGGMRASGGHISDDVINDFLKYVTSSNN